MLTLAVFCRWNWLTGVRTYISILNDDGSKSAPSVINGVALTNTRC